jgi:hypothetical protein
VAETCTGTSAACPADSFESVATACTGTSQGGVCDDADHCSGTANTCIEVYKAASVVCRADAGECDVAENCTGTGAACPADGFELASVLCTGASQGALCDNDAADHCTGTANTCVDVYRAASVVCRADAGQCDVAENCTGTGGACPANAYEPFGTTCDDGSECTVQDACDGAGACDALTTVFNRACTYFSLGAAGTRGVRGHAGHNSDIVGDLCFARAKIFAFTAIDGNTISTSTTGRKGLRFGEGSSVTGDIVSDGAGVFSVDGSFLPHLTPAATALAGGSPVKTKDNGGVYDLTGSSLLVDDCAAARADVEQGAQEIAALVANQNLGYKKLAAGDTLTLVPTNPGGVNVINIDKLRGGSDVTIEVDGGGDADTVMIVRVAKGFKLYDNAVIEMTNSMQSKNFILFVRRGRTDIGNYSTVAGTIYGGGFLRIGEQSIVDGQLFGAGGKVEINAEMSGVLVPNEVVLP